MTILMYDDVFLRHDTGPGHPENAKRLENTVKHLKACGLWERLRVERPRPASVEEIGLAHPRDYAMAIKRAAEGGGGWLDGDTAVSPASYEAAIRAVGAPLAAIDMIMRGEDRTAFCLVRPPGHHATPARGMGFCLFNNAAIAARYVQQQYQVRRALIVDWDVHHGNGTQDAFYRDATVLFFSLHRYPFYPGSGRKEEDGQGEGKGFTVNLPLAFDTAPETYIKLFTDVMEHKVGQFAPEFIIISAGFDAYKNDPIGGLNLDIADFRTLTEIVVKSAGKHCGGRVVSCLEGGYHLTDLPFCIEAHIRALGGE